MATELLVPDEVEIPEVVTPSPEELEGLYGDEPEDYYTTKRWLQRYLFSPSGLTKTNFQCWLRGEFRVHGSSNNSCPMFTYIEDEVPGIECLGVDVWHVRVRFEGQKYRLSLPFWARNFVDQFDSMVGFHWATSALSRRVMERVS